MKTLGIDHGSRWFGLALSDSTGKFSRPLESVDGQKGLLDRLPELIRGEGVSRIVLGLPRNMDGSMGRKAEEVLNFAVLLRVRFQLQVETWDERLTTMQAERALRDAGVARRRWKERVDSMAAQILLQSFLDARSLAEAGAEAASRTPAESPPEEESMKGEET